MSPVQAEVLRLFCTWNSSLLLLPNVLSFVSGGDSCAWRVLRRGNLGCFQAGKIPRTPGGKTLKITEIPDWFVLGETLKPAVGSKPGDQGAPNLIQPGLADT